MSHNEQIVEDTGARPSKSSDVVIFSTLSSLTCSGSVAEHDCRLCLSVLHRLTSATRESSWSKGEKPSRKGNNLNYYSRSVTAHWGLDSTRTGAFGKAFAYSFYVLVVRT